MRIFLQIAASFALLLLFACSSKSSLDNAFKLYSDTVVTKDISASEKEANLIFFRSPQDRKNTNTANVFVNNRYLSTLLTEGYSAAVVCPGENNFYATARAGKELPPGSVPKRMRLEAGKTYFIELNKGRDDQYDWQVLNAEEATSNIEGLKRQAHTISRYSEDCALKLAKEEARAREQQAKVDADKVLAKQQAAAGIAPIVSVPALVSSSASSTAAAQTSSEQMALDVASARILFPFAQFKWASVNTEGRHAVQSFATDYKRLKLAKKIRLSGHADPIGDEHANMLLSQKRVKTIRAALVAEGVHARFEEMAMGSRQILVDCSHDKGSDDLGIAVTRSQKSAGTYWVQIYADMSAAKGTVSAEQKVLADTLKTSVVLKKSRDGLARVWLGQFNDFTSAEHVLKASAVKDAFVRFVAKSPEFSANACNQPNRRVDIEIVE